MKVRKDIYVWRAVLWKQLDRNELYILGAALTEPHNLHWIVAVQGFMACDVFR